MLKKTLIHTGEDEKFDKLFLELNERERVFKESMSFLERKSAELNKQFQSDATRLVKLITDHLVSRNLVTGEMHFEVSNDRKSLVQLKSQPDCECDFCRNSVGT